MIVVLGSSTAAGLGPRDPKLAWVSRYRAYLAREFPSFSLTNLAVGGYTSYHVQASDFTPPPGRPSPDPSKNITAALALAPNAIIVNLPSNDQANGYAFAEQMKNYERLSALAAHDGVALWVTTAQPRDFVETLQLRELVALRNAVGATFAAHSIDFWTDLATPDAKIRPEYGSGDGIHLNDAAHALLAERVIASKIPEHVLAKKRVPE